MKNLALFLLIATLALVIALGGRQVAAKPPAIGGCASTCPGITNNCTLITTNCICSPQGLTITCGEWEFCCGSGNCC